MYLELTVLLYCRDVSPDFLSVGVSGVDCSALLEGRPYGGCSILYRKSLVPFITPLIAFVQSSFVILMDYLHC